MLAAVGCRRRGWKVANSARHISNFLAPWRAATGAPPPRRSQAIEQATSRSSNGAPCSYLIDTMIGGGAPPIVIPAASMMKTLVFNSIRARSPQRWARTSMRPLLPSIGARESAAEGCSLLCGKSHHRQPLWTPCCFQDGAETFAGQKSGPACSQADLRLYRRQVFLCWRRLNSRHF